MPNNPNSKVTPITSHRKKPAQVPTPMPEPQPLIFPRPGMTDEQLRNLVAKLVARALYKTAERLIEPDIVSMGYEQFEVFIRSVLQEDE
jgi:hypothetical protein